MLIRELEYETGLDRATIRFYEKEGLITPKRAENGYRDYSQEDAAELKKIALLRELGVTLETIRNLQQGSADFSEVMKKQSRILAMRSQQLEWASFVCQSISADCVDYAALDPAQYQGLLSGPQLPARSGSQTGSFREPIEKEIHPWRRYAARSIDYALVSTMVDFAAVVILRWRPVGTAMIAVLGIIAWFVLIPIEAAMLHFWGTTLGKWIMGIRIEYDQGGNLSWDAALDRTWGAICRGVGFGVPYVHQIVMLYQYCRLTGRSLRRFQRYDEVSEPTDMSWDDCCELRYAPVNWKGIGALIVTVLVCMALIICSSFDAVLPKYRGNELKISEFCKNFNMYNEVLEYNTRVMQWDGTFEKTNGVAHYQLGNGEYVPVDMDWDFEYSTQEGNITAISDCRSFYDYYMDYIGYFYYDGTSLSVDAAGNWLSSEHKVAMIAMAAAQPGMSYKKLEAFIEEMNEHLKEPAAEGVSWTYGDLTFSWKIDPELYYDDESDYSSPMYKVTIDFEIQIQ